MSSLPAINSAHITCMLPDKKNFQSIDIENYILPSRQNLERGRALLSCGSVRSVRVAPRNVSTFKLAGYVQAEKKSRQYHLTKLQIDSEGKWKTYCMCQARNYSTRCKHQAAFLFALVCLRDHQTTSEFSKEFKRKGIQHLQIKEEDEDWSAQAWAKSLISKEAELDLTWRNVLEYLVQETDNFLPYAKENKISLIDEPVTRKERKKNVYCYCGSAADNRPMVECSGQTIACQNSWYISTA